jgi:hypothetical protein
LRQDTFLPQFFQFLSSSSLPSVRTLYRVIRAAW